LPVAPNALQGRCVCHDQETGRSWLLFVRLELHAQRLVPLAPQLVPRTRPGRERLPQCREKLQGNRPGESPSRSGVLCGSRLSNWLGRDARAAVEPCPTRRVQRGSTVRRATGSAFGAPVAPTTSSSSSFGTRRPASAVSAGRSQIFPASVGRIFASGTAQSNQRRLKALPEAVGVGTPATLTVIVCCGRPTTHRIRLERQRCARTAPTAPSTRVALARIMAALLGGSTTRSDGRFASAAASRSHPAFG